jgi:hypothetical protein
MLPRNMSSMSVRTFVIPFYYGSGSAKAKSYGSYGPVPFRNTETCLLIPNAFENLLSHTSCGIECGEGRHLILFYCLNEHPDWSSASRGQRMGGVLLSGAPALAPLHTGGERSQPGRPATVAGIFTRQRCACA